MADRHHPSFAFRFRPAGPFLVAGLSIVLSVAAVIVGGGLAHGQNGDDGDGDGDAQPTCIEHRGEARYRGLGYQHVVIIENGCDQDAHCEVSTNITPETHLVDVPAGENKEVITRTGSPARAFEPQVSCSLR